MAKNQLCPPCRNGQTKDCKVRWQAPSARSDTSGGSKPRQAAFTYKCPNRPGAAEERTLKMSKKIAAFNARIKAEYT
jgi:hypothetical protein